MSERKKWYARWDIIGILGLVLAVAGIGYSMYSSHQQKIEAAKQECREKSAAVAELHAETKAKNNRLSELGSENETLREREEAARAHYQRARRYINAQNAELTIGRTSSAITSAISSFKQDHGPSAFDIVDANTWVDYLAAADYPKALVDRQNLARNMIDWGLERGAANFMVLTPRDEETTLRLVEALQDLSARMAVVRDENYFDGIQGIRDTGSYLAQLETGVQDIRQEILSNNGNLQDVRTESSALEARLRESEQQYEALNCVGG